MRPVEPSRHFWQGNCSVEGRGSTRPAHHITNQQIHNAMKTIFKVLIPAVALILFSCAASFASVKSSAYASEEMTVIASADGEVSVVLKEVGPNKVKVIKVIRTYLNVELRDAKDLVDSVEKGPVTVAKSMAPDQAAKMKAELEEAGAKVEVK